MLLCKDRVRTIHVSDAQFCQTIALSLGTSCEGDPIRKLLDYSINTIDEYVNTSLKTGLGCRAST